MNRSRFWKIWKQVRRDRATAVLVLAVAALPACGREPARRVGGDAGGTRAPAASATVSSEKVAGCAGFTAERAAAFLGVPAADVKDASTNLYDKLRMCSFSSAQEHGRMLGFSLRRDDSVEEASLEMARLRENVGLAQGVIADTTKQDAKGPAYEEIPGLGDEAIWAEVNGTLNVRKGNVAIQVMSPSDRDAQKRLAEQVVAGLS